MIHALEHPILLMTWNPDSTGEKLSDDLHLKLDHRHFIWFTFQEAHNLQETIDLLFERNDWKWEGIPGLLESLADLPLNPGSAYALSFLGSEPISFETFLALSNLPEEEAARMILTLWAVGVLTLAQGELPSPIELAAPAGPQPSPGEPAPPPETPPSLPPEPEPLPRPAPEPPLEAPPLFPEFLNLEAGLEARLPRPLPPEGPHPLERARILYRRGHMLQSQNRTAEAIRCLEQSVQLDPASEASYTTWLLLGRLRMSNPAWSTRTINAFQAAARIKPGSAEPWVGMGEVYQRKGFQPNANACFRRALELDPSVPIPQDAGVPAPELVPPRPAPAEPRPRPRPRTLFDRFKHLLR